MNPQPFYTSKGFWSSFFAEAVLIFHMATTGQWSPELIAASTLVVMANVFRWTANQPLSLMGGTQMTKAEIDTAVVGTAAAAPAPKP